MARSQTGAPRQRWPQPPRPRLPRRPPPPRARRAGGGHDPASRPPCRRRPPARPHEDHWQRRRPDHGGGRQGQPGEQRPPPPAGIVTGADGAIERERDGQDRPALGHDRVLEEDLVAAQEHGGSRGQPGPRGARNPAGGRPQQQRGGESGEVLKHDGEDDLVCDQAQHPEHEGIARRVQRVGKGVRDEQLVAVLERRRGRPSAYAGEDAQRETGDHDSPQDLGPSATGSCPTDPPKWTVGPSDPRGPSRTRLFALDPGLKHKGG